jgi:hypothetical protein
MEVTRCEAALQQAIARLRSKLERLCDAQWADLLALQREQLELLERLLSGRRTDRPDAYPVREQVPGTAERIRLPRRRAAPALAEEVELLT